MNIKKQYKQVSSALVHSYWHSSYVFVLKAKIVMKKKNYKHKTQVCTLMCTYNYLSTDSEERIKYCIDM